MSFNHLNGIMFDIETLGKIPGSIILSIGACRFNIQEKRIYDEFYVTIDAKDSAKYGLTYDKETLEWWKDYKKALKEAQKNSISAHDGLEKFFNYLLERKDEPLWAWGSHFDIPIVTVAMKKVLKKDPPWKYYSIFDARTIQNVFGVKIERDLDKHHNSLYDAKEQAKYLIDFFNSLIDEV